MPDFLDRFGEQLRLAEQKHYGTTEFTSRHGLSRRTRRRGLFAAVAALVIAAPAAALVSPWNPTVGRPGIDEPIVPPSSAPVATDAKAALAILRREQTTADREAAAPLLRALGHPVGGVQLDGVRALGAGWILAPAEVVDVGREPSTNQLCMTNGEGIACGNAADADTRGVGMSAANDRVTRVTGVVPDRVARVRFVTTNGTVAEVDARNNFYVLTVDETMPTRMIRGPKDPKYTGPEMLPSPPTPIGGTVQWLDAAGRVIGPERLR